MQTITIVSRLPSSLFQFDFPTTQTASDEPTTNGNTVDTAGAGANAHDDSAEDASLDSVIDMEIFSQILELDEEDSCEFSYEMVLAYFDQAKEAFSNLDSALCVHVPKFRPTVSGGLLAS
jgi:hypothetical protein